MSDDDLTPWEDEERKQFNSVQEELRAAINAHWRRVEAANVRHFHDMDQSLREMLHGLIAQVSEAEELPKIACALIAAGWVDSEAIWNKAAEILAAKPKDKS